jgi:hypothetical protein
VTCAWSYPFHSSYAGHADAFGQVIQAYVNEHPPDEVVRVTAGRDLGWPYCNPDPDENHPTGSLAGRWWPAGSPARAAFTWTARPGRAVQDFPAGVV